MDKQSIREVLVAVVTALALIGGVLALYRFALWYAYSTLRRWAAENGFEILECKRCFWSWGLSLLTKQLTTYFVRVRDPNKHERSGWVRCGSWDSFLSRDVEVKWKDRP